MEKNNTLYQTYLNAQSNNREKIALFTRECEAITHDRMFDEIDKVASWLLTHKTNNNYKVGIISSSSYEEAVILFATNKIGGITKFIDFTKNSAEIIDSISGSMINLLVIGCEFMPMEPLINKSNLPVIIIGEDQKVLKPHHYAYKKIINEEECDTSIPEEFKNNTCAVIINSSGTTGIPKPIELSDYALNAAVSKMLETDYPLHENTLVLKTIPSHIGLGLITTLYTCLIVGVPVVYIASRGPQEGIKSTIGFMAEYERFLNKFHLDKETKLLIFAAPMFYRFISQSLDFLPDLSFVGCMLAGGSAMSKEELEKLDSVFAKKGCKVPILNGYGQNEMAGAVALNQNSKNRRGSAGVAVSDTKIRIVDIASNRDLPNNTIGKVLEQSDSLFLQYENMPEATKKAFIIDRDGNTWFDTNDLGYLDEDGFLFITGRTSRVVIKYDCKISLDIIENKIRESRFVKEAGVITVKKGVEEKLIGFVTLNKEDSPTNISESMKVFL